MTWEPDRYLQFSGERLRPALDLIAQLPSALDGPIVDLGCGAGNVTRVLAARWPDARIEGVDSSAAMLARARGVLPKAKFVEASIEDWRPTGSDAPGLLFSNAALHWVPAHETLFPRLIDGVAPGGLLAVQMPGNFDAPSHRLIRELAASARWSARLGAARMGAVLSLPEYRRLLVPRASRVALWETLYWQALEGDAPVLEWLRGTTLIPYLEPLSADEQAEFLGELAPELEAAYPRGDDGVTLFPFRRIFIVARRRGA